MGLKSLICTSTLLLILNVAIVKPESYNVLLPNGEIEKNLDLPDLKTILEEHYLEFYEDPELNEISKRIANDMLEKATLDSANLSQVEREKLIGDTLVKIARATLEACRDFLYEKTGKHIIEIVE